MGVTITREDDCEINEAMDKDSNPKLNEALDQENRDQCNSFNTTNSSDRVTWKLREQIML